MASGGAEEEDEGISLDIDDMHMLLHVEHEQIQKRTFAKWINAQLAKRSPPSRVSDLFDDLKDGSILLDLLEMITGQPMTRQRIHGVFQQRADIETALDFLKNRSVKLVNINVPDIIDGKPAIILGLIWAIILHFHIEEMATSLPSVLPPSSLDSLDITESNLITQPSLHKSFGLSAKQALLTWAQNRCHRVGCSISITDFTSSWSSGEAFLAVLCSLRPELVDLTQVQTRTNLKNLEQAFELAERELRIPRLLEPHDVDVPDPDEKSVMTYVAQFLSFSIESSSPVANTQCSKEGPTESRKAKRRLEKTRRQVQTRIQQAIKLFSSREITEAEARRKERALKSLHPALLEGFLSAVDTFGSFCSEPQLQDLKLLSDSIKKQWEDIRTDMSDYIDMLWCKIREIKQQVSVEPCERHSNTDQAQEEQEIHSVRSRLEQDATGTTTTTTTTTNLQSNLQSNHQPTSQEEEQSAQCFTETLDKMESTDDDIVLVSESINKIVSKPITNTSSMARTEPSVLLDSKISTNIHATNMEFAEEEWHEDKQTELTKENVFQLHQPLDLKIDVSERVKYFTIMGNEEVVQTNDKKIGKRTSEIKPGESSGQRQMALLRKLMDLQTTAEEIGLQEVTLPALHQRSRALMKLESSLSNLHSEFEHIKNTSQSENHNVEHLWEVTTKMVSERQEQCVYLAELLKRFQKISAEVGETLQRAESTVKEQASYMGRDTLHRLHTKVIETKSELNNLGDMVGELRSASKQLHSHLQQIPHCTSNIRFEPEAQNLMDHWLDISERVESNVESLQFALSLWDGALKMGMEVELWTSTKLATFAHSPFLQSEEDIEALQAEIRAQEESIKCFSRITTEIHSLLQTAEPPLELQVRGAQMRKRMDELQELISEAEEVFRQTEAAKTNVSDRMTECLCSLHSVHQSLLSLSGPDPTAVLSQLKDLYLQLQVQNEQALALHDDLQVLASVGRPDGLEALWENGHKLQEAFTQMHQLFTEVEEQTQRDIQLYHKLQAQVEHFKQKVNTDEVTQDPSVIEDFHHRARDLTQLVLLLRNSKFQKSALIEESGKLLEQYYKCESSTRGGPRELHESLNSQFCVKEENQPEAQVSEVCGVQRGSCAKKACARGSIDDMKDGVQKTQVNLRAVQPYHLFSSGLQVAPKLNNNMREECIRHDSHWSEMERCLSLLKAQLDELSITGEEICDDEGLGRLLQDCCHKLTSLQGKMSSATPGSVHEVVLQQLTAIEKVLSQHVALRDPNNSISQEIHNFLHLKRALDDNIKDKTGQEQKQQNDQHMEDHNVSNEDSFRSVGAGNFVTEAGSVNGRIHMQQGSQTEQNEPPTSNQQSSGLEEFIWVDKEDHAASHSQPSHPLQIEKKIEIQESPSSEENPISAAPGNDPKWRPQTQNLVTCLADVLEAPIIVQDSQRKILGKLNTGCNTSAEETTPKTDKDDTDFCNFEDVKVAAVLPTVDIKGLSKNKIKLDTEAGNIGHVNEEERLYLDGIGKLLKEVCKLELPVSSEDTSQMTLEMEPEKTNRQGDCCLTGEEATGEEAAGESSKHKFTMKDILEGVQSLVENSCIINREPRLDLKWFLNSFSSEAEIQLMQTIQRVFVCRYEPAQPNLTVMTTQLQEAEKLKCCVKEKVDSIKCASDVHNSLCSTALLDATATAQVKAAQLDQVIQYHRQQKMTKAFLEVVMTQKENMNLHNLGSSELLAEQLNALLKTMDYKKCLVDDLVKLSRQLSINLSCTEKFGVFGTQITDIQREWTLLEQNVKTALQYASNSASQLSTFRQEAKALKNKLEELFISLESFARLPNFKNTWYLLTWTADLKMYTQQCAYLRSRFDDITHYIGQRDKDVLKKDVETVGSVLNETKMKLGTLTENCVGTLSNNLNMQLQDLVVLAKKVECHIITGGKLALFPEEAHLQITEMEKFQSNILFRQAQIREFQFQEMNTMTKVENNQVRLALEELYQTTSSNLCKCIETMKDNLKGREALFNQLASMDTWLSEIRTKKDETIQQADLANLEKQYKIHVKNVIEIEGRCKVVDDLEESCKNILVGLSPGDGYYLVNRLAGIRMETCGILAHEKAFISELEELMNLWTKCDDDLSKIETGLQNIGIALNKQRFPLTQESLSEMRILKCKLTEHQCQVQVIQHCQEAKRTSLLDTIGELLNRCNVLCLCAIEQDKYVQLRRQMEQSNYIVNEQILSAKDKVPNLGERYKLFQHLLVELPLVKTQCQEVADQLEAIAQELHPSELNTERQMIRNSVDTLVTWENVITEDIKNLENQLKLELHFKTELLATMELMQKTKQELERAKPLYPDEKAVDVRIQKCWVHWRNMESAMRVLEGLARKEKKNLRHHKELYATRNAALKECLVQMESLSKVREALKDYQWAAQGAVVFLHNAETTFLSSSGGFADCTEQQRQIQQALDSLQDGFEAHVDNLTKLTPQQPCLSRTEMEEMHSQILGQLLVRRAVLEAKAQLRLEALHRCSEKHQNCTSKHDNVLGIFCGLEDNLSKCATEHITSYEKCVTHQKRTMLLLEDLQEVAGQIKELGDGCPVHGCEVGRAGEVSALWRKWTALRRKVGLLLVHTELKAEEWKNITSSIEQCRTHMASLQTDLPLCSPGGISEGGSPTLLDQAELHQAGLEKERRVLASLEQRLEHALSPSHSQAPTSPGPLGKTLVEIKDSIRSLMESNRKVVETAQLKEKEKQQVIKELTELDNHVSCLSSTLESSSSQSQQQEYKEELSSHKTRLQHIMDRLHSCYSEIPLDIYTLLQDVQLSLQTATEKVMERSAHVERLSGCVEELRSGLERVRELLKQRSPSVTEAQNALKHVWDELDLWHGRLMLLESEVQDLAEDLPDQAHLLMDQLTEPLQCYQDTAQMVEQHTAFLSKIPACLREFENILYRATCWLEEADSWLSASCSFTTAKSLQNHATSLELLLEDSERIRLLLQEFRPVLCDICAVCDVTVQEQRLEDTDQHVVNMQQTILQPIGALLQAATVVENLEAELKTIERNVSKMETILALEDNGNTSIYEHLHNRQVIVSSAESAKKVLKDMQRVKEELDLPWDSKDKLLVWSKATSLLQQIQGLEQLSLKQATTLEGRDEIIRAADLPTIDEEKVLPNVEVVDGLPFEQNTSLDTTESWLLSVRPWLDTSSSEHMESDLNFENAMCEPPFSTDVSTVGNQTSVVMETSGSLKQEVHVFTSAQARSGLEDTRVVPVRPITPFAAAAVFEEEEHGRSPLSPIEELDTSIELKQNEGIEIPLNERYKETSSPNDMSRSNLQDENDIEQPSWIQLSDEISQTLSNPDESQLDIQVSKDTMPYGACLQTTQQAVLMLRPIVNLSGSSEHRELFKALKRLLFSLDTLSKLVLTSVQDKNDAELKLLQNECFRGELVTLSQLLNQIEIVDKPEVSECVVFLQQCVRRVSERLQLHVDLTQQQALSNRMVFMDYLELKENGIFQRSEEAPNFLCVLVGHLRRSPEARAELRQASQSLLQGIRALVEMGEESTAEGQRLTIHCQTELQAALQRLKKLQEILVSQLAFTHLFQQEALKCHEDEWAQLQVRARALQQQALDQLVTFQWNLQEWTQWEDNCGHLGRLLDESEGFLSREELNGSDAQDIIQQRIQACQEILSKLDKSRNILGLLLDQGENLQAASVRQKGGALELQWRDIYRQTEGAINRCRDMQEHWASFQTNMASLNQWLHGAKEQVQTCSGLAATSDLKIEHVHKSLITLLDLSVEVGSMSALKASVCRSPCPSERQQLTYLETQWSQLTSALCKTQEQLQQHLLKRGPSVDMLSALEDWLEKKQTHFNEEKEENPARRCLQQLKGLKSGLEHGQLLLDFLCQSGPPLVGDGAITLRSERTMLEEKLGALRLRWGNLQGELEIQINGAEHMHQIQAQKQKKLQHLQNVIDQKKTKLDHLKQPCGEVLARRILLEWEGHVDSLKNIAADVEELKDTWLNVENEVKDCTSDVVFSEQVEELSRTCEDVIQQMDTLHPSVQQTAEKWSLFKKHLKEISLYSVRLHCSLHQIHAPVFSLQEAERSLLFLQELELTTNNYEDLWDELEKSCHDLVKRDQVAADVLKEEMERERARWKGVLQDLKDEIGKTQKNITIWQEFTNLLKSCSLQLHQAWTQWEELHSPDNVQARAHILQEFQEKVESVERTLEHVLVASKLLIGQLDPMASNIVQSQTNQVSRDLLILSQALHVHKKNTKDDIDQLNVFLEHLERLENQMKEKEEQINKINGVDCAKVFRELSSLFWSMFDISEMSANVNLSNQEAQRLHHLQGRYVHSLTHGLEQYKQLQSQHYDSLDFDGKCKALTDIQDKLEQESTLRNPENYINMKHMATVHQNLQGDIVVGHQLLHGLQCDAVKIMENTTDTQRLETLAKVSSIKQKWIDTLNVIKRRQSSDKQLLSQYITYQRGLKHLYNIIRGIDSLQLPTGHVISVSQIQMQDYKAVEKALQPHSAIYTRVVDTGKSLCKSMTDPESQMKLQIEIETLEKEWEHSTSQLGTHKAAINNALQKWEQCQKKIAELRSQLDECGLKLKKALPDIPKDAEEIIQETEFSLRLLRTGKQEVDTMKTDLSHYLPLGDTALLEQQLEQLHSQWEELCTKVSLRKQEIADRLNAWTIFNDKNKEFCDWLTQMENKVCHSADLSFEEMVEKLKKDCMEEINLFSENKRHLKQLGEQLLRASDEAKQSQVHGSLQEANQRWHGLFHHIQDRVKKLKETLATVQQLDKNMSNLRSWLCRIEAELSRPITYSVLHHQEIHKRLAEHQELQRDIEQHTEGVVSVLSLCDVLLQDQDASHGMGADSDSLQETSRSLDQRWRTICAMALDRRLRIEETWRLWCKFLDDYSRFEDWLKMAERTAANPNTGDILYTEAKEELKKFEAFQRQVNERLTQLEIVNNQYRRLARENRTDRASQLKAMVQQGNRRWDALHRRVGAILRRLKYFTSQREEFETTRESMLVWLTELDLQLTNVEHFSESDVHHKIQQLNSFQKEIRLNTERIDGLIVFGEGLIQRSAPGDAAHIENELEELHTYCQEVFGRLVRFHQRLSQPPDPVEPKSSITSFSLESSLELIGRPWLGRSLSNPLATPTHLLATPLSHSGRETPVSVDSLPLEWDHTGDVGGSSSHEDEEDDDLDDEGAYFSAVSSRSVCDSPRWRTQDDPEFLDLESNGHSEAPPTLSSTPLKQGNYLHLISQCSGSIEDFKRVSLILDEEDLPDEFGLVGLNVSGRQSGVIERWELLQAQSQSDLRVDPEEEQQSRGLDQISSWLDTVTPQLQYFLLSNPPNTVEDMTNQARVLKEMQKMFADYKSTVLSLNLTLHGDPDVQQKVALINQKWSKACTDLQHWDTSLRKTLVRCQEFHKTLHSLLLWLSHAESRRYAVDIHHPETSVKALKQHCNTLTDVREELMRRQSQHASLHALWSQLQPEHTDDSDEAQEKLHVTGSKMKVLLRELTQDLSAVQKRLENESASDEEDQRASSVSSESKKKSPNSRERREPARRSFFHRLLRAAFPLHLLLLLLLLMPCLIPTSPPEHSCTGSNNFARSFQPMLRYTNGPPPT
ncbi:nesprin-2 isoform X2 [Periophthalmus magnuspinnatus]|uniref:nesprin-2 isoform X2 n=1 Tax=Periophthalmus magnuspinnatus TaxID=409849 RepID=UPI00243632A4|nr:nesprin-2 isoform X2 [Periophthalmus magnuspinnatus]